MACLFKSCFQRGNASCKSEGASFDIRQDKEIQEHVDRFLSILFDSTLDEIDLQKQLRDEFYTASWKSRLAEGIFKALSQTLSQSLEVQGALKSTLERVMAEAYEFAQEHPVYCMIIALGILICLSPWVIEALGFAEYGIVEDSVAALWQSTYRGYVPKRSLFSFFQRLGMTWAQKA